jgi:hypothetical protein
MSSRAEVVNALAALLRVITHADNIGSVRSGSVFRNAQSVAESAAKGNAAPLPWTKFEEAEHLPPSDAQIASVAASSGVAVDVVRAEFARALGERLFVNSRYQVSMREHGTIVHLSIKRIDQAPIHDWRDLQRIKDELVGPDCEAVELYPAAERLVDTSTQYHLWCAPDPKFRFPFGFTERLVTFDQGSHAQREQEP